MTSRRIAISTQTPLVRFSGGAAAATAEPSGGGLLQAHRLADFTISPGGVSRMVLQTIRSWRRTGWADRVDWYCLQPEGPRELSLEEGIDLHHLRLPPSELQAYARIKERLWSDLHGLDAAPLGTEDFRFYARYNGLAADAMLARAPDFDAAYVHDFQLLQVGALVGLAAPCVLRWHVPFDPSRIPRYTRHFLVRMMEAYDGVIVSTRRDLQGLSNAGYHGKTRQIYPHSEPADWARPAQARMQEFEDLVGAQADTPIVLCVARMDPMKRQDLLLQAFAHVRQRHPEARLVCIGNGSFSGLRIGGLGVSKGQLWRAHLEALRAHLHLEDAAVFTGWIPDELLAAAYARADVLVLPSQTEGFGLTPFEAWSQGKPCVVSSGCGIAEIVQDEVTGRVFPAGDAARLAQCLDDLLGDRRAAQRMGEAGRFALQAHTARRAAEEEAAFLEDAMARFGRTR